MLGRYGTAFAPSGVKGIAKYVKSKNNIVCGGHHHEERSERRVSMGMGVRGPRGGLAPVTPG